MDKERVIELFRDYVLYDLEGTDPAYIREVLRDNIGCTDEELKELELYYELGFDEEDRVEWE